jgi:hypothetical protein
MVQSHGHLGHALQEEAGLAGAQAPGVFQGLVSVEKAALVEEIEAAPEGGMVKIRQPVLRIVYLTLYNSMLCDFGFRCRCG